MRMDNFFIEVIFLQSFFLCRLFLDLTFFFPFSKVPKGNPYHSATSGEMAIYRANSLILRKVLC